MASPPTPTHTHKISDYPAAFTQSQYAKNNQKITAGDKITLVAEVTVRADGFDVNVPPIASSSTSVASSSTPVSVDNTMVEAAADAAAAAKAAADAAVKAAAADDTAAKDAYAKDKKYLDDAKAKAADWVAAATKWQTEVNRWNPAASEETDAKNAAVEESEKHLAAANAKQAHIEEILKVAAAAAATGTPDTADTKQKWNTAVKEWKDKAEAFKTAMEAYATAAAAAAASNITDIKNLKVEADKLVAAADIENTKSADVKLLSGGGKTKRRHRKRKYRGSAKKRISGKKH